MYSKSVVTAYKQKVLKGLRHGVSVLQMVKDKTIPSDAIVYRWLARDANFRTDYNACRIKQLQYYGERTQATIERLPDDPTRGQIAKAQLSVSADQWIASRMLSSVYGANIVQNNIMLNVAPIVGMTVFNGALNEALEVSGTVEEEVKPVELSAKTEE